MLRIRSGSTPIGSSAPGNPQVTPPWTRGPQSAHGFRSLQRIDGADALPAWTASRAAWRPVPCLRFCTVR